jgi:hypothetical protein
LINWYSVGRKVGQSATSRGEVVKAVSTADSPGSVPAHLNSLPLERINPFRLIGVFPGTMEIVEWRWDLVRLTRKKYPWQSRQWISSGFDEAAAQRVRSGAFRRSYRQVSSRNMNWIRTLHQSHEPHCGPFSTCMHRTDAVTVSYTEVAVSSRAARMRYHAGTPCETAPISREELKVARPGGLLGKR